MRLLAIWIPVEGYTVNKDAYCRSMSRKTSIQGPFKSLSKYTVDSKLGTPPREYFVSI